MDVHARSVYTNTLAEGSRASDPQVVTEENVRLVANAWRRGQTVFHFLVVGAEPVRVASKRMTCLVGDIGCAKILLPEERAALPGGVSPESLVGLWVSGVIEGADFEQTPPILSVSREKALSVLQERNERRKEVGREMHAVVQGETRGAWRVNASGFPALLPKAFYSWDTMAQPEIGSEFAVVVKPSRDDRLIVSRRDLMDSPYRSSAVRLQRGAVVLAHIRYIRGTVFQCETLSGASISVDPLHLRSVPKIGSAVKVRVLGENRMGYFGIVVA